MLFKHDMLSNPSTYTRVNIFIACWFFNHFINFYLINWWNCVFVTDFTAQIFLSRCIQKRWHYLKTMTEMLLFFVFFCKMICLYIQYLLIRSFTPHLKTSWLSLYPTFTIISDLFGIVLIISVNRASFSTCSY